MRGLPCPAPGAGQALGSFEGTGTVWKGSRMVYCLMIWEKEARGGFSEA